MVGLADRFVLGHRGAGGAGLVLVVALALAGCSEPPAAVEDEPLVGADSFESFELQDTAPASGVIRGVVVDLSLAPMAGVSLELIDGGANTTSNEEGVFAFRDVTPGTHFVKASRPGYEATQSSVDVVAGVPEPPILRILLARIPGTEPHVAVSAFDGFITCSLRIPTAGFNDGCGVFGDIVLGSTQRLEILYEGPGIQWWQGELTWESNSPTSERLCLRVSGETLADDDVCGATPVLQVMNATHVEMNDLNAGETFEVVGYPDHLAADASGNLVLQQAFKVVHHAFYNFSPPEGWTFSSDGEPVVPP